MCPERFLARVGRWALVALALGCHPGADSVAPSSECVRIGERCALPGGGLGVCTQPGASAQAAPSIECASQH